MKTRKQIAKELMSGCPDESYADHKIIADAIINGDSWEKIETMRELNAWPDTYVWVKNEMNDLN